tara:strand:- start:2711 stop:3400 length:690 start_codon:yes stop_codon:yes gene_type:complete
MPHFKEQIKRDGIIYSPEDFIQTSKRRTEQNGAWIWNTAIPETISHIPTGLYGMWEWTGIKHVNPSPKIETGKPEFNPNACRNHGVGCKYQGAYEHGQPIGDINIFSDDMKQWGEEHGGEFICRNCKVSPEAKQIVLSTNKKIKTRSLSWNALRRLNIVNNNAEYTPYDPTKSAPINNISNLGLKNKIVTNSISSKKEISNVIPEKILSNTTLIILSLSIIGGALIVLR